jgi:hypothetical protein
VPWGPQGAAVFKVSPASSLAAHRPSLEFSYPNATPTLWTMLWVPWGLPPIPGRVEQVNSATALIAAVQARGDQDRVGPLPDSLTASISRPSASNFHAPLISLM